MLLIWCILRQVACNLLKTQTSCRFLTIKHLPVLILLLHFELTHRRLLLAHHILPLLCCHHLMHLVLVVDILLHPVLVQLVIKHALIRVLQLVLVQA